LKNVCVWGLCLWRVGLHTAVKSELHTRRDAAGRRLAPVSNVCLYASDVYSIPSHAATLHEISEGRSVTREDQACTATASYTKTVSSCVPLVRPGAFPPPRWTIMRAHEKSLVPVASSWPIMPTIPIIARRPLFNSFVCISFSSVGLVGLKPSGSQPRSPLA